MPQIPPHVGYNRAMLRYHLGLIVPKNRDRCFIGIADETPYAWAPGGSVLFDDTRVHYVRNDTPEARVVLFVDIERNFTGALAVGQAALRLIYKVHPDVRHVIAKSGLVNGDGGK